MAKRKTAKKPVKRAAKKAKRRAKTPPAPRVSDRVRWATRNYVGIRLFAGRANPRWPMTAAQIGEIQRALLGLPIRVEMEHFLLPNSWYGGVVVNVIGQGGARRSFFIFNEHVYDSANKIIHLDANRKLEARLFKTMPADVNESIQGLTFQNATRQLNERHLIDGVTPGEATPQCETAPSYLAPPPDSDWDTQTGIDDNNCYNYANDKFSDIDDFQPGRKDFDPVTEHEMHLRLTSDRLIPVAPDRKKLPSLCLNRSGANLLAVCLRGQSGTKLVSGKATPVYDDYHCFRLDANGYWSHKDGSARSTNTDNGGILLSDLATGKFKLEHTLVGYYWSVPARRRIGMPT